jgi:hypothetical protein
VPRDHDDRDVGRARRHAVLATALERAQEVEPVVVPELDVEHDEIDRFAAKDRLGLRDRAGLVDGVAFAFEHHAQRAPDVLLVVHDQDRLGRSGGFVGHDLSFF